MGIAMKTITITRERGFYGAARAMGLYVDGDKVGNLMQTKSLTLDIADDAQTLYAKMDWAKTEPFDLSLISDSGALVIKSYFPLNPLKLFGIGGLAARIMLADVSETFR